MLLTPNPIWCAPLTQLRSSETWIPVAFVVPGTLPPCPPILKPPDTLKPRIWLLVGWKYGVIPTSAGVISWGGWPRLLVGRSRDARNELTSELLIKYVSPNVRDCVCHRLTTGYVVYGPLLAEPVVSRLPGA